MVHMGAGCYEAVKSNEAAARNCKKILRTLHQLKKEVIKQNPPYNTTYRNHTARFLGIHGFRLNKLV